MVKKQRVVLPSQVKSLLPFMDKAACNAWLAKTLCPEGPVCQACGSTQLNRSTREKFFSLEPVNCERCARQFSARTDSILAGAQVSPEQFVLLLALFRIGMEDEAIAEQLDVHRTTVTRWRARFKEIGEAV